VAEGPVYREPVSAPDSQVPGKNAGKFVNSAHIAVLVAHSEQKFQRLAANFPAHRSSEIVERIGPRPAPDGNALPFSGGNVERFVWTFRRAPRQNGSELLDERRPLT
jgi:hypothetical protein